MGPDGVDEVYIDKLPLDGLDGLEHLFDIDLFEANSGIALDGVEYNIRIIATNIDAYVHVSNPNTEKWKKWEAEIWAMGKRIAKDANDEQMIRLFE
ncbi:hypothetical protein [Niabella hibiscisoli]|uniref:hypothetical protein n=1 Tax=Niabella hibiscisoli TaxID=1825928 RepID=UPI001F0EAB12|nr:hypothetical protein [Niabella hibiscisoli]MCH5715353.1 hypothetical protein [Niabella hibiscisoli]